MFLKDILSFVLRSCPGTALAKINFGWSILDSYFSILFSSPFPFTVFYSKTCKSELWMVRSWIPSFLIPFSFRCFFSKTCAVNLSTLNGKILDAYFSTAIFLLMFRFEQLQQWLLMGRCGGRGRVHHKYMLNSKHPSNILSFHGSKGYSIHSFAQLS